MNNNLTLKLKIDADGKAASAQIVAVGDAAEGTGRNIDGAGRSAAKFTKAIASFVSVAAVSTVLQQAAQASLQFHAGLDEVSTLLSGEIGSEMERLTQAAKDQAIAYGSFPIDQVSAQYQIISAGADSAAEAVETLEAANRLAVAGVTDVGTAASGLTSILNSYGERAGTAADVSDAMFVAMKAGVTNIGELSANIGQVTDIASNSGIAFEEMLSAVSALTKTMPSTSQATTGLRAIIASVIKPTQEATEMAAELGMQFDAEALASKGLSGFLEELKEKTGGNIEVMGKLFGGVEALTPALALVGGSAQSFADILEDMKNKAGATDESFDKIASGSAFQLKQIAAQLYVKSINLGDALLTKLNPAITYVNDNFNELAGVAKDAATAIALLLGARASIAVVTSLAGAMAKAAAATKTVTSAVGFLKAALALVGGPLSVAIAAIGGLGLAIYNAREESRKYTEAYQNGVADIFQPEKGSTYLDQLNSNLATAETNLAKIAKTSGTTSAAYAAQAKVADNLRQLIGKTTKATDTQTKATGEGTKATEAASKAAADLITKEKSRTTEAMKTYKELNKVEAAQTDYNTKLKDLDLLLDKNKISTDQYEVAQGELKKTLDDATGATQRLAQETNDKAEADRKAKQAADDLANKVQSITDRLNPAEAAARQYKEELQNLQTEAAEGNAMAVQSIGKLAEEYQTTQQKIAEAAAEMALASNPVAKAWNDMGSSVQQGLSGMLDGSIKSFGDFADSMEGQLKSMLANMASQWISSSFTKMVGGQGQTSNPMSSLTSMFAGGSPAPGSQAAMLAEQTAGMDGGSFGSAGNAAMAAAGPIGIALAINSLLTPVIEKKLGRDAGNGMKYGGLSGAFAGKVLGFGSRKQTDSGVTLDYSGGEIAGQDYKRWKKKKWGHTKRWTDYSEMDSGLEGSLNDTMDELEQGITRFAENLGRDAADYLENFSTSTKLSLKGMDEEEATAAIESWVQETGGAMLKAVMPEVSGLIDIAGDRVGEMVNSLLTMSDYIAMDFAPEVSLSLWETGKQQLQSLNETALLFDGSVDAANEMASSVQQRAAIETQMLQYIEQASASIDAMFGATREGVLQDMMSSSELYSRYKSEAESYYEASRTAADPEEIARLASEGNRYTQLAYQYMSTAYQEETERQITVMREAAQTREETDEVMSKREESIRSAMSEKEQETRQGFIDFIDEFNNQAQNRLDAASQEVKDEHSSVAAMIEEKLGLAANDLQGTTSNLNDASGILAKVASNLEGAVETILANSNSLPRFSFDDSGA